MSDPSLTKGALLKICQGGTEEKPTLQVLQNKKIEDRYRLFVSDGQYSGFSALARQMHHFIIEGKLEAFTIVRVNNHLCCIKDGKRVIILLEIEVLKPGSEVGRKIGDPLQIGVDGTMSGNPAQIAEIFATNAGAQKRHDGDDNDDSVIEVEVVPNTKEVAEIDLTNSPMPPKITTKTVIAKTTQETSKRSRTINENLDDNPVPSKSARSQVDESSSSSSIVELDDTPPLPSSSTASSSVATNTTPVVVRSTAEATTNTSPEEKAEGCPICLDSVQDIRAHKDKKQVTTSCGHIFCSVCIANALRGPRRTRACPICKKKNPDTVVIYSDLG